MVMKDSSMENKLRYLYALQQVDTQLQDVQELKGDLPMVVAGLESRAAEMKAKLKELNDTIKQAKIDRDSADVEIIDLAEKVEKYKSQQLHVKSNRQYDALTKEIEEAEARSTRLEKEMETSETKIKTAKTDIEGMSGQSEELSAELQEKQKELREVNKEHEKEELKLQHEREKLLARIERADLDRYERIRKAKGGKAVVPIRRDACGGCFSRVPPQKILEIRQNSKFFQCEHCGRILVSDQVVEKSAALV